MATFGERLRELREEKELSQTLLAEKLGVSNVTINRWEHNNQMPDGEMLDFLANFFDVNYYYITGVDEDRRPNLSDEEAAKIVEAEENEILLHMVELIKDLSPEMQKMVKMTVANAYQIDKERGRLCSQEKRED